MAEKKKHASTEHHHNAAASIKRQPITIWRRRIITTTEITKKGRGMRPRPKSTVSTPTNIRRRCISTRISKIV